MTKISKKSAYTVKLPVKNDYFVGTDSENNLKTVNFDFKYAAILINSLNGNSSIQYVFKTSENIPLGVLNEGEFYSLSNETTIANITKLYVNKYTKLTSDLEDLYNFLLVNSADFLFKMNSATALNTYVYFNLSSIEDHNDYYVFNITPYKENAALTELVNLGEYFFDFELKTTSAGTSDPLKLDKSTYTGNAQDLDTRIDALESQTPGDYVKIVYVNALSPNTATIFSEVTPPVTNNDSLKEDTDNLYIGTDLGNWLWNPTTLIYGTKLIPNASNFKLIPSGIDAGSNKTSDITREGSITTEKFLSSGLGHFVNRNGSNTPQIGGFFAFLNAIGSGGNMFQLNSSNGIDLWNYASSAWTKRFTFSSSGTITATAASLSNEVVVKSQLDLKVDKDGTKVLSDVNFSTALSNKLASIDATHYLAPLQTTVQLSALPQAGISDKARVYVENDLSDYFYDATASSGDIAPDDQVGGIGFWKIVAVGGETAASIKTKYESNPDTNAFTDAEQAKLANQSGTNTGDQDLSGKQDVLVSATNIKTVGGVSLLGGGDVAMGVTRTVKIITSASLATQDAVGFVAYINALGAVLVVAANETVEYQLSDTGRVFKLLLNGRSFGTGQPAITTANVEDVTLWMQKDLKLSNYPSTRNDGQLPTNRVLSTDVNGNLKMYTIATAPAPYLEILVPDSTLPSTTTNFVLKGAFFTQTMTVSIVGQTINSILFVSDNLVKVNVTTGATEGLFAVTLNNGISATFPNALSIVLGTVFKPAPTDWINVSPQMNISTEGELHIGIWNVYQTAEWTKQFDYTRNFRVAFALKKSPFGTISERTNINDAVNAHISFRRVTDNVEMFKYTNLRESSGYAKHKFQSPLHPNRIALEVYRADGTDNYYLEAHKDIMELRYIAGIMYVYVNNNFALSFTDVVTSNLKMIVNVKQNDFVGIKYIETA